MIESEALELILYCGEKWGAAAAIPTDHKRLKVRVQVWMDALADVPAADVRAVLSRAEDEFPPNVIVVRRRVQESRGLMPEMASWDEFWSWVRKEASRCSLYTYTDHPEFRCPWPALDGLVTLEVVCDWARNGLTAHDLENVLQAHVRRSFDARVKRVTANSVDEPPAMVDWRERQALSDGAPVREATRELAHAPSKGYLDE